MVPDRSAMRRRGSRRRRTLRASLVWALDMAA
ncbi:MAG: hypothetical protein RLZ87_60 [Armatimonadota bacterium]